MQKIVEQRQCKTDKHRKNSSPICTAYQVKHQRGQLKTSFFLLYSCCYRTVNQDICKCPHVQRMAPIIFSSDWYLARQRMTPQLFFRCFYQCHLRGAVLQFIFVDAVWMFCVLKRVGSIGEWGRWLTLRSTLLVMESSADNTNELHK